MKQFLVLFVTFFIAIGDVEAAFTFNVSDTNAKKASTAAVIKHIEMSEANKPIKIGLIIANSRYKFEKVQLPGALNDARDVDSLCRDAGFQTTMLLDTKLNATLDTINKLRKKFKKEMVFFFFFAGHGSEYQGHNYFHYEDSRQQSLEQLSEQNLDLSIILEALESAEVQTRVIILDCCRKNPNKGDQVPLNNGRMIVNLLPKSSPYFIVYATTPGAVTSEKGRNGYLTSAIMKHFNKHDPLAKIMTKVIREVMGKTQNSQIPVIINTLTEDLYLYDTVDSTGN